jgi:tRNA wybutosine-synthesizing protein 3
LTGSSLHAHNILSAALQAGFRESGALNLLPSSQESATPMVAIRSMGLSLESVIGYIDATGQAICCVPHGYLHSLRTISEDRFAENTKRINRFRTLLKETISQESLDGPLKKNPNGEEWEDANVRRERKKAEGIARAEELRKAKIVSEAIPVSLKEILKPE